MQERLSAILSGKDTTKLLEALSNDLLLRSEDDPSVMGEEQHSSEHHTMLRGKTIRQQAKHVITAQSKPNEHTMYKNNEMNRSCFSSMQRATTHDGTKSNSRSGDTMSSV
jgi:hypothetical protein